MALPCQPTSSTCTSTPSTRSSTGRAGSRRSRRRRPRSRCPPSRSPTTARWPARSTSTRPRKEQGIKPIIGCEVYVVDDRHKQHKGHAHLTLLAETNEGYGNLIKLCSLGYLEGYYYRPRVDWELLERHAPGLIALSGCLSGRVSRALTESRAADAEAELDRLVQIFGRDSTYVELQNAGLAIQEGLVPQLASLAAKRNLPLVATGDVHYLDAADAASHEALLCIQSGDSLKNPNHWKFETNEFYFKTPGGDGARLPGPRGGDAADARGGRAVQRRDRARPDPAAAVPDARGPRRVRLPRRAVREGAGAKRYDKVTPELVERLQFELKTIREMGFADYFLIVSDFIDFAKRNGVSVGPGRGSAAGSLAAYSLGITDIDPMRYGLLFERFLNPARKDMPDMDIDFAVEGRERVINYVAEKYGRDRVAQIITFSTMAARAALRDAGARARGARTAPSTGSRSSSRRGRARRLDDALKPGAELRQAVDTDPVAKEIIDLARPLEGLTRADSIHAAGVVIGAQPLMEIVPLQQKGPDAEVVTQFSMKNVEALGLLKIDFLGLRNLDVIDEAVRLIGARARHRDDPAGRQEDVRDARARRDRRRVPVRVVGDARRAAGGEADRVRGSDRARRALPARARCSTSRATRPARTGARRSRTSTSG